MSAFDKIIGYEPMKEELGRICDMVKNQDVYTAVGAALPRGIFISGDPGLGKTLMARCFIEECGIPSYTLRRTKNCMEFVNDINETFRKARESAPAIVFLDDMDKFANEDTEHRDAAEYVAVQAGIDDSEGSEIIVIATANEEEKLPDSLMRPGRFDIKIRLDWMNVSNDEVSELVSFYLSDKKFSPDTNMEDIGKMVCYRSCSELKSIVNEAAIYAGYARKPYIETADFVRAVLRQSYYAPVFDRPLSEGMIRKAAFHEAGHLVMSEVLRRGSVGLVSLRMEEDDNVGGFIKLCKHIYGRWSDTLVSLAGKAAVELYFGGECAEGCYSDLQDAHLRIRDEIFDLGTRGLIHLKLHSNEASGGEHFCSEIAIKAEMERLLHLARTVMINNREFLEKAANLLYEKRVLLFSDIKSLEEGVTITRDGLPKPC